MGNCTIINCICVYVQDYSWEDHGFSLVNRLYSDIGHLLDDRFRSVASLPSPHDPDLKRAIWNYIHCIYGIRYNHHLQSQSLQFFQAIVC